MCPCFTLEGGYSQGLAIDWIHDRIFICDTYYHTIWTGDLDDSNLQQVVATNYPYEIILDPCRG